MKWFSRISSALVFAVIALHGREAVAQAGYPPPMAGYVSDYAGLLTKSEKETIQQLLWQVESASKVEIVVVTVNSIKDYSGVPNNTLEEFATGLFNSYGIGHKTSNNGVLLLVAKNDRKVRIELGKGFDRSRNADATRIIDQVITPRFRASNYAEGISEGVKAIAEEFGNVKVAIPWALIGLGVLALVLLLVAISLFMSGKTGWGWVVAGLLMIVVLAIIYMVYQGSRHKPSSDSDSWAPGGLDGFGGGSSDGGGASGDW